jgi:hypothetical protein
LFRDELLREIVRLAQLGQEILGGFYFKAMGIIDKAKPHVLVGLGAGTGLYSSGTGSQVIRSVTCTVREHPTAARHNKHALAACRRDFIATLR